MMNQKIEFPSARVPQSDSLDWVQSYGEIISLYILHVTSPGSVDACNQQIKHKIYELLSFLCEKNIQAQDEFAVLNEILNQIKAPEITQEHQNIVEDGNGNIILTGPWKKSQKVGVFQCVYEEYRDFLKRIEKIQENLKDILSIKDYQIKKGKFEKLMRKKQGLQKAVELRELMKSSARDFENQEIRTLQEKIQACQIWSLKVKEYLEKYEKYMVDEKLKIEGSQIREITRGMNMLKEEMNLLILKEEELENKILKFEWEFQARLFLSSGLAQSEIKYWRELLKKVQERGWKEILDSEKYKEVCKQVVKYGRLIEQVKEIEDQEKLLIKLGNNRKEMEAIGLKDLENIKSLLKKLSECKVLSLREEIFLQRILDQAEKVMKEYENLKESPTYIPIEKFQSIVKMLEKLPIKLPQEIQEQLLKEERINELLKEVFAKPNFEVAQRIYNEYEGCYLDIPDAQKISRAYSQAEILKTIEDAFEHRRNLSYKEICQIEKQFEHFPLDLGPELHGRVKLQIWLIQVDLIKTFKENPRMRPEKPIPLQKVCECFLKGHDYLDNIRNDDQKMLVAWKNSIKFIKDLIREIDAFFAKISNMEDPQKENGPFSHFIDMEEKLAELKATAAAQRKVFAQESQSLLKKRREPSSFVDTASTASQQVESEDEILTKKLKTGEGEHGVSQDVEFEKEKIELE